ncbi:MAG: DUF1320 domain-containing protein [Deltaproteobacteria bacterium]|nr:DUF1320 domain-containing protein [Deltaproteobacteria bacterium]
MPYCTQDDLLGLISEAELAQLTAEAGDVPDSAVVDAVIAKADAEIDGYLAQRYVLPIAAVPALVKSLSEDMAVYHLYSRRGIMAEARRQKYRDAVTFLKDVAAGRAQITDLTGAELPSEQGTVTEISSADRVFSRETMGDW